MLNTGLTIFPTSGTTTVNVRNSSFDDLGQAGIAGAPSGTGKVRMSVVNTELDGDQWGISSGAGSKISATRCDASENATAGLFVHDGGVLNVTDCLVSGNTNAGGNASGLLAQTSGIMRVSNSTITDNDLGLSFLSGGQLLSRLNNTVEGNGIDGTFSGTYGSK